jgi:hypothetical protein
MTARERSSSLAGGRFGHDRGWGRTSGMVAWSLWALSLALLAVVWVVVLIRQPNPAWPWPTYPALGFSFAFPLIGLVGALIVTRRPTNTVGWLFCSANLLESLAIAGRVYVVSSELPGRELVAVAATLAGNVGGLVVAFSVLLFPDGRLPSPAWRVVAWLLFSCASTYILIQMVHPGPLLTFVGIDNPVAISGPAGEILSRIPDVGANVLAAAVAFSTLMVLVRLRRARGVERQQLKWFAFAAALLVAGLAVMLVYDWNVGTPLSGAGLAALPVAMGIAIVRYRLYDIDVIINRTLVYGSLTAVLAGVFAGLSILTQRLVLVLTGQESQAAVVLAALVVTALFQPLRARMQVLVDRRFYRRKYDATRTLEQFASQIRDEVELDQLTAGLVAVVRETMQPTHASLWLRSPRSKQRMGR